MGSLPDANRNLQTPEVALSRMDIDLHEKRSCVRIPQSRRSRHLAENPHAALVFYWIELDRQVRINGPVEETSRQESARYFHSRPIGSQLGAWASRQSEVLDGRRVLDARMAEVKERYADKPV